MISVNNSMSWGWILFGVIMVILYTLVLIGWGLPFPGGGGVPPPPSGGPSAPQNITWTIL